METEIILKRKVIPFSINAQGLSIEDCELDIIQLQLDLKPFLNSSKISIMPHSKNVYNFEISAFFEITLPSEKIADLINILISKYDNPNSNIVTKVNSDYIDDLPAKRVD